MKHLDVTVKAKHGTAITPSRRVRNAIRKSIRQEVVRVPGPFLELLRDPHVLDDVPVVDMDAIYRKGEASDV